MRQHTPKDCTILVVPPGQSSWTFAIRPLPLLILGAITILTPVIWLGTIIYSLHLKNHDLIQQNHELSETADEVMHELEALGTQIQVLQERAGISDEDFRRSQRPSQDSQGGLSTQLEAEDLLSLAKAQLLRLSSYFHRDVKPALNETLDEEAARADAKPTASPVKNSLRISSEFGFRSNPFGRGYEFHNGIDFAGPIGTPIYATGAGVIEKAEWSRGYGYHVIVSHGYGYRTLYAHLSEIAVSQGDPVSREQLVGYLGNTGRSTGPHLHYTIYRDDQAIDPKQYLE